MAPLKKLLHNSYGDPASDLALLSADQLYKKFNGKLTYKQIESALMKHQGHTMTKRTRKMQHFNRWKALYPNEIFMTDLIVMPQLAETNNSITHLLTVQDLFTRFLFVYPVKNKGFAEISRGFSTIFLQSAVCKVLVSDHGSEFTNQNMKAFLKRLQIKHWFASTKFKCAPLERVQLELQKLIFKHMYENNTKTYVDVLQNLVNIINRRHHRHLNMSPTEAYQPENRRKVLANTTRFVKQQENPLQINDRVLVVNPANKLKRGYDQNFGTEIHTISHVNTKQQRPTYKVKLNKKTLTKTFHRQDLLLLD